MLSSLVAKPRQEFRRLSADAESLGDFRYMRISRLGVSAGFSMFERNRG
jgi:hypothetical protein